MLMKTYTPKKGEVEQKWYVVDADGQVLGRLATSVASVLRGKHKPQYTPFLDTGDHVIVINAAKVRLTGNKREKKVYYSHSGYPGGLKQTTCKEMMEKHPERVVMMAVKGMLPHNALGRAMLKKLRVYAGPEHDQEAQKPEPLSV
jgi:large subunit ribosomal protein L13